VNLGQIRNTAYLRAGVSTADGLITTAMVNDAINEGNHAFELEEDWPWLEALAAITTVAGTDGYAHPADWSRTLDVRLGDDTTLTEQNPYKLKERWAGVANGQPVEYGVYNDVITLRPIPDGVYTVNHTYIKQEPELVLDTDTPLSPVDMHTGLAEYAAWIILRRSAEDARAQQAWAAWQAWLARTRDNRRRVNTPGKINVREGYEL
jgi:hypothetical protein